jgi:IS1 family transposase
MVCNPLFHEFVLLGLLWQVVISYWTWKQSQVRQHPLPRRSTRPSKAPKPFAGLTKKSYCQACEHGQEASDQPPLSPPPLIAPRRGRPRTVDTHHHYCPNKTCTYYGWVGQGNLRANGHPGGGAWRQLHCVVCETYFLETSDTLFYGKPRPAERMVGALAAVAEGLGIRAVARVFDVDPHTVQGWLSEAAAQLTAFSHSLLHDVHVEQVQFDELCAWLSASKAEPESETLASGPWQRSPHWIWAAIDPVSKVLLAIEVGERTLEMAQRLVHHVGQTLAPGCMPLFLTDGLKEYATALLTHLGQWVGPPRPHPAGPAPKPRWVPHPELLYAQVSKTYRRRRLVRMRPRVVFGTLAQVTQVLAVHGWQINTAFIERANLAIRQHVAAMGRRVLTLCKHEAGLRQQLAMVQVYHNFCLSHASLRLPLPQPAPTKGTGSAKRWHPCTPAMAAGLTDHVWTLRAVLLFRVPPWPQP